MFLAIQQLQRLHLSKNRITVIQKNVFIGLSSLQYLDLRNNQIIEIDISGIGPGCSIDLSGNKLRRFQDLHGLPLQPYWIPIPGKIPILIFVNYSMMKGEREQYLCLPTVHCLIFFSFMYSSSHETRNIPLMNSCKYHVV